MNKLVALSISITAATLLSSCSTERVNDSKFPVKSVLAKHYDSNNENTVIILPSFALQGFRYNIPNDA